MNLLTASGGKALLDFLRNLTPQIVLLTTAILLFTAAGEPKTNMPLALYGLAVCLVVIWLLAFIASFESFMQHAISDSDFMKAERKRIRLVEKNAAKRAWKLFCSLASHSKITFLEFFIAVVVTYSAILTVVLSAIKASLLSRG
ncbi:hypothetical protein [Stenotrophomonas sp. SrG]|uniref:hypothetical protein n=1 Tax=Stenotrophomonas sp. SrG TaxID=3414430 RepID=UPI003CF44261